MEESEERMIHVGDKKIKLEYDEGFTKDFTCGKCNRTGRAWYSGCSVDRGFITDYVVCECDNIVFKSQWPY